MTSPPCSLNGGARLFAVCCHQCNGPVIALQLGRRLLPRRAGSLAPATYLGQTASSHVHLPARLGANPARFAICLRRALPNTFRAKAERRKIYAQNQPLLVQQLSGG